MQEKLITVVIPAYNAEKYIYNTVQVVLNQTYVLFDLIVVNDGSKDKTLEVLNSIQDERLKVISIKNSGVSVARNQGISAAKTQFIAFLDADDYWENTYLEEIVDLMNSYPKIKIFQTGRSLVYKEGIKRYNNILLPSDNQKGLIDYLNIIELFEPPLHSSAVVVSREHLIENRLFKESQRYFEDHDLWLRLCYNQKIAMVNKPLSFYRKDNEQAATTKEIRTQDFITYLKTLDEVLQKIKIQKHENSLRNFSKKLIFSIYNKYKYLFSNQEKQEILVLAARILKNPFVYFLFLLLVKTNFYFVSRLARRFFKLPPIY